MTTTRRPAGRKNKLTSELIAKLSSLLAQGSTIKDACASVGVSEDLYYDWVSWAKWILSGGAEGKEKTTRVADKLLIEFIQSVEKAKSSSYIIAVNEIRRAGSPYWRHTITGRTFYKEPPPVVWMHKVTGEIEFIQPIDERMYEKQFSGVVFEYKEGKWQAQAWYLERSDRANWGANIDIAGSLEPVEIVITRADDDETNSA